MNLNSAVLEQYRIVMGEEFDVFLMDMIDSFLSAVPEMIRELWLALGNEDNQTFRRIVHTLKSNSRVFGDDEIADLAYELETLATNGRMENVADKVFIFDTEIQSLLLKLGAMRTGLATQEVL
jgi:HPt (histidine-containing phosphotransfer) domain-containing protein